MTTSLSLCVKWTEQTRILFGARGHNIPWNEEKELKVRCPSAPMTIDDLAKWIEARIEGIYAQMTGSQDDGQAQVMFIRREGAPATAVLPWIDEADRHLKNGDVVIVDVAFATAQQGPAKRFSEGDLEKIRKNLRFGLNDRVLCFCGPRWLSGWIVGTAVPEDNEVLPYLVKTDPLPGLGSRTICAPIDRDDLCTQDVCFDPSTQLHLTKAAAQEVKEACRPKLRFADGDRAVVRIHNSEDTGLEQWVAGKVSALWPKLAAAPEKWSIKGNGGEYPNIVPYKVELDRGSWVYCHRDHFTLIRREDMKPHVLVKGMSQRFEVVKLADGAEEKIDHCTGRRKRMAKKAVDSDSDDGLFCT